MRCAIAPCSPKEEKKAQRGALLPPAVSSLSWEVKDEQSVQEEICPKCWSCLWVPGLTSNHAPCWLSGLTSARGCRARAALDPSGAMLLAQPLLQPFFILQTFLAECDLPAATSPASSSALGLLLFVHSHPVRLENLSRSFQALSRLQMGWI